MKPYHIFISLIIIVKVIFVVLALINHYLKFTNQKDSSLGSQIEFWKSRVEFVFIFLMSLLLIYLFNPRMDRKAMINKETEVILFMFGIVLIITADWSDFFKETATIKTIQSLLGTQ
jgi:surface polysaccharide O-acyltransferase-like enzyme